MGHLFSLVLSGTRGRYAFLLLGWSQAKCNWKDCKPFGSRTAPPLEWENFGNILLTYSILDGPDRT